MLFKLVHAHHSAENQRQLRRWYLDNGVLLSEIVDHAIVDSVGRTLRLKRKVAVPGQEDQDFPEHLTDVNERPVTIDQILPLAVEPLTWMLTMTGAWSVDRTNLPTLAHT